MGEAGGSRGVWGYVEGGMGGLANALEKACLDLGVKIKKGIEVSKIQVDKSGKAYGVIEKRGKKNITYESKAVASSIDATQTLGNFVSKNKIPPAIRTTIENIDYSSASGKINIALDGLPDFGIEEEQLRGTIHISPSMKYIEEAYLDASQGRFSKKPILEIVIPSLVDKTLAPEGKHIMSIFVQYAPYELAEGNWDEVKEEWIESCISALEPYAPDIREKILHIHALTPLDLEREYRLTGGNIMQGAMPLHQLGSMRPMIGWSDHRTPIRGLYLCGASTHPGGGVMGACGRNASKVILSDLRKL
jgi:phytoene dehydrogenase-like protein